MSTHVSSWWKLDFEWLISVGSFGSLPNVRMKNKTSECIKFGCERSDAIYERSDTNREQWFRIRIPKSEVSGDGPLVMFCAVERCLVLLSKNQSSLKMLSETACLVKS